MSDGTTVRAIRAIRTHVYVAIPSLILGAVCGTAGWHLYQRHVCGDYSYVNPDLACGEPPVLSKAAYGEFAHDLLRYMENKDAAGIKIGVFFRDLGNGPVFGINEDLKFIPASLMKLPTVITYFDLADELPGLLETELPYTRESIVHFEILQQVEAPAGDLREGRRYSIEQLMRNTIVFSDNLAYYVLLEHLKEVPDGDMEARSDISRPWRRQSTPHRG
jgi:hypothetical protein